MRRPRAAAPCEDIPTKYSDVAMEIVDLTQDEEEEPTCEDIHTQGLPVENTKSAADLAMEIVDLTIHEGIGKQQVKKSTPKNRPKRNIYKKRKRKRKKRRKGVAEDASVGEGQTPQNENRRASISEEEPQTPQQSTSSQEEQLTPSTGKMKAHLIQAEHPQQGKLKASISHAWEEKFKDDYDFVIGLDEAGRGPLAGPVVTAACYVPLHTHIPGVRDSKKLTEVDREKTYDMLQTTLGVAYDIVEVDNMRIDEENILNATLFGMGKAALNLIVKITTLDIEQYTGRVKVLVDGNKVPEVLQGRANVDCEAVPQGDDKVLSIAAASILAKVTRDRMMYELHKQHPQYGFDAHKGYPTSAHIQAIADHGLLPIHRMTFNPIKDWLDSNKVQIPGHMKLTYEGIFARRKLAQLNKKKMRISKKKDAKRKAS